MGKNSGEWTPERRAAHGELTRRKMRDPAVRAKISRRTREAMAQKRAPELLALREAWSVASAATRTEFLSEILAVLIK